ncbi:MAG: hypothetical protein M3321_04540 [Actinomycetota bacterium]|nr:hypothetical protein [Actinomycetota bacterium]
MGRRRDDLGVESEPLLDREEVTAMLFALADINLNIRRILNILRDVHGEEEEGLGSDA